MAEELISSIVGQVAYDELDRLNVALDDAAQKIVDLNGQAKKAEGLVSQAQNIKDLTTATQQLSDVNAKLVKSQQDAAAAQAARTQAAAAAAKVRQDERKAAQDAATASKAAMADAKAEAKATSDLTNEYAILSKAYTEAALRAKNYSLTLGANNPVTKAATAEALVLGMTLKDLDASVGQNQRNVGNYSGALQGYVTTLRGLRGPVKLVGEALGVGAQAADQLRIVLEHSIQGLAAYFRGKEGKTAAEKANTGAVILNSLATDANTVAQEEQIIATEASSAALKTNYTIKDSNVLAQQALNTSGQKYTFTLAANTLATEANAVAMEADAIATTEAAVATTGASVAMTAFKIAIAATGIGLLVVGIAYAVIAYQEYKKSVAEAELSQKAFAAALDDTNYKGAIQDVASLAENIDLAKKGLIDSAAVVEQYNDSIGKAAGSVTNLHDAETGLIKNRDAYVQMMLYKAVAAESLKESVDKAIAAQKSLSEVGTGNSTLGDQFLAPLTTLDPNAQADNRRKKEAADSQKQSDTLLDIFKKFKDKEAVIAKQNGLDDGLNGNVQAGSVAALRKEISTLQEKIDTEKAGSAQQIADTKQLIALQKELKEIEGKGTKTKVAPDNARQEFAGQKELNDVEADLAKQRLERDKANNQAIYQDTTRSLEDRLTAYGNYAADELNEAQAKRDKEVANAQAELVAIGKIQNDGKSKTIEEINSLALQKKAANLKITAADEELAATTANIVKDGTKQVESMIKKSGDDQVQIILDQLKNIKTNQDAATNAELKALDDKYAKEKGNRKKYEAERKEIVDKGNQEIANQTKDYLQEEINDLAAHNVDVSKLQEALNKATDDATKAKLQKDIDALNTELAARKAFFDKAKQQVNDYAQAAQETGTVFKNLSDARVQQEQAEIDAIGKKKDADIAAVEASTLSAADKAKAEATINSQAAADQARLEKEQAKEKHDEAVREKELAIALATIKGILFVLESTSIPEYIARGVLVAAEIAAAATTPIPTYALGTEDHPGGLAVLGDAYRPEVYMTPGGKIGVSPAVPTLFDLPQHTQVIPSIDEYMRMTAGYGTMRGMGVMPVHSEYAGENVEKELRNVGRKIDSLISVLEQKQLTVNTVSPKFQDYIINSTKR